MKFFEQLIKIILATTSFLTVFLNSNAQSDPIPGNWQTFILKANFSPKISSVSEIQLRSSNYDFKYDYFETKTGISYALTRKFYALIGLGIYHTFQSGGLFIYPARQKEFRTWFELNYKHLLNRLYFEHRGRIEQRFIPDHYKNRIKYRVGINIPVNKSKLVKGSLYLALADELFIPLPDLKGEKNRFYAGTGYKLNANTALQIGCIKDTDYKMQDQSKKSYLQILLIYDFTKLIQKQN